MKSGLFLLALLSGLPVLAAQETRTGTRAQGDEIDRLADDLVQPGPDARPRRLVAVERLLGNKELRAHDALVAALAAGEEAETVVRALVVKLANPSDPVFGWNPSPAQRARVLRAYGEWAVATLGAEPQAASRPGPVARARALLVALRPTERLELFKVHFALRDDAKAARAIAAAAECRDLGLGPEILRAGRERPALALAVREALRRLWFAPEVQTLADAEARAQAIEGRTYLELAEEAARGAQGGGGNGKDALRRELVATKKVLLELAFAAPSVDWPLVHRQVLPEGSALGALPELADLLGWIKAALLRIEEPSGDAGARAAFVRALLTSSESAPLAQAAAMLECAALLVPTGDSASPPSEIAALLMPRLHAALASPEARWREAGLFGLLRHPSAQNRARVVQALRDALSRRDAASAGAALRTLASKGYVAPLEPPESVVWLAALQDALRSQDLDSKTRSQALLALGQRDQAGNGTGIAFKTLGDLAGDAALEPWLRQQALAHFAGLAQTPAEFEAVTTKLVQALADAEARVRAQAAELLGKVPSESWRSEVLTALRGGILHESDRDVLASLLACAKQRTSQTGDAEPIVRLLQTALEELGSGAASRATDPLASERRPAIANALTTVAATQGVPPLLWARAAQALLATGDRERTRVVLDRQLAGTTTQELPPDVRALLGKLVVEAALRKPREVAWSTLPGEAAQVVQALDTLETLQQDVHAPGLVMLRLEALVAAGRAPEAAVLVRRALLGIGGTATSGNGATSQRSALPADVAAIATSVAEALRTSGDASGALGLCADLKPVVVGVPSESALHFTRLAASLSLEPARERELREDLAKLHERVRSDAAQRELLARIEDLLKKPLR